MESRQKSSIVSVLGRQQARYPLIFSIGLFVFLQLLSHDAVLYSSVELGESDVSALNQLYFEQWNHEENRDIGRGLMIAIGFLISYGIAIRIAQRKV